MVALKLCKVISHSHLLITGGAEGQVRIWVGVNAVPCVALTRLQRMSENLTTHLGDPSSTLMLSRPLPFPRMILINS